MNGKHIEPSGEAEAKDRIFSTEEFARYQIPVSGGSPYFIGIDEGGPQDKTVAVLFRKEEDGSWSLLEDFRGDDANERARNKLAELFHGSVK